ncbi:MAG: hypothetical protein WBK88_04515 [Methanothrix sp.]
MSDENKIASAHIHPEHVGIRAKEWDAVNAEIARLRADLTARDFELESLSKENERLAEMLAKGVYIESAALQPESYDICTRGAGAMLLAEKLVMFFKSSGGENFVTSTIEMEFADPKERERYALTIQKLDGEDSPAQKIERQARRIAELLEALEPFTFIGAAIPSVWRDDTEAVADVVYDHLTFRIGDVRKARAVLEKKETDHGR